MNTTTKNPTNAEIKADIRLAISNLLEGNERLDSGRFNTLFDYEVKDLKDFRTRIDQQTGDIDMPLEQTVTLYTIAAHNRHGSPRRPDGTRKRYPGFLSEFEDAVFYGLSKHYFDILMEQGLRAEWDEMYQQRNVVVE